MPIPFLPCIIPRGSPDIGWSDLFQSLIDCFRKDAPSHSQREVESLWSPAGDALACLSVRSGLDLLLHALAWPAGSEVLVSALTIPGILQIFSAHGLVPIPLDLDSETLSIRIDQLQQRCGPRTRGVFIAHLFGSRNPLDEVIRFARERNLWVIEDCAQAYSGPRDRGHAGADACLFSFGPIKTCTALGGAIVSIRHPSLLAAMRHRQASYRRRSTASFLQRVLLFAVLKALSRPQAFGICVALCRGLHIDYDAILGQLTRGFARNRLLEQLRQQPLPALLRLLARRLRRPQSQWIQRRIQLTQIVASHLEQPLLGRAAAIHTHWVLPVISSNPAGLVQRLGEQGFDATRKGSNLIAVPPPLEIPAYEPTMARYLVEHLTYLPLHPALTERDAARLCSIINTFEREAARRSPSSKSNIEGMAQGEISQRECRSSNPSPVTP